MCIAGGVLLFQRSVDIECCGRIPGRTGGAEIEVNYEIFSFSVRFQPGMKAREEDVRALQIKRDSSSYDRVLQNSAVDLFLNERLKLLPGNSTAVQYLSRRTSSWN